MYSLVRPREILQWSRSKNKGMNNLFDFLLFFISPNIHFFPFFLFEYPVLDCPALSSYISHFNRVAVWGCKAVVEQHRMEARKESVLRLFETCAHLLKLKNYMGLFLMSNSRYLFFTNYNLFLVHAGLQALLSSLSHHSVVRMKETMSVLQPHNQEINSFVQLLSHTKSFARYVSLLVQYFIFFFLTFFFFFFGKIAIETV